MSKEPRMLNLSTKRKGTRYSLKSSSCGSHFLYQKIMQSMVYIGTQSRIKDPQEILGQTGTAEQVNKFRQSLLEQDSRE